MAAQIFLWWYHNCPLGRDSLLQLLGYEHWTPPQLAPEAASQTQGPPRQSCTHFLPLPPTTQKGSGLGLSIFQETTGLI